jgi:hypothetical protein
MREDQRNQPRGRQIPVEPMPAGSQPLFTKADKLENLLSRDARERVERVIFVSEHGDLSWSSINAEMIPLLFKNFRNAEVVAYTDLAELMKAPAGRTLIKPTFSFTDDHMRWNDEKKDRTVALLITSYDKDKRIYDHTCALAVGLPAFGLNRVITTYAPGQGERTVFKRDVERTYVQVNQRRILAEMGFEGLPGEGERITLTPEMYSGDLRGRIKRVKDFIDPLRNGRPLILVNPLKGMRGHDNDYPLGKWQAILERLVREVDAAVVINEGPCTWLTSGEGGSPQERIMNLYRYLRDVPQGKVDLIEVGTTDRLQLAALLHLCKATGGCLLDIQSGQSHLAELMEVPEVVLKSKLILTDYLRPRDNLIEHWPNENTTKEVIEAVKKLMGG